MTRIPALLLALAIGGLTPAASADMLAGDEAVMVTVDGQQGGGDGRKNLVSRRPTSWRTVPGSWKQPRHADRDPIA